MRVNSCFSLLSLTKKKILDLFAPLLNLRDFISNSLYKILLKISINEQIAGKLKQFCQLRYQTTLTALQTTYCYNTAVHLIGFKLRRKFS